MSLSYLGLGNTFHRVSGSSGGKDFFGFDQWTEKHHGPPSKFEQFLRNWPRNKEHGTYKWLYLVDLTWTEGPEIEAVLSFKGTLDRDPKPHLSSDTRLQPLQLRNSSNLIKAEYYGPVSTYRYIVVGEHPRERAYAGQMLLTNFTYEIVNQRGAGTIAIGRKVPRAFDFLVEPRVVLSRFACEQVGACWQVTEENEGRLESALL